ncbi:hypothetical protein RhiirA5_356255 [Rhizophagus irregularis]|uniref:Uncharacterized protein n=2 Tax=Rhizophagus irregularis TaxID=588596 RepID=U9UN47_RHIID|nr:hypothetical protein GLOIN_2v1580957 [Rhizophagus irregularis DAOM 181602=DAOM 197198]PKC09792.1 hypothetical protein RhiirA5_356255 [Rhizophagus irregularis]PKC54850.1 hypothetical protein RhiirA1_429767 [Rhizophagus irregularis]PKY18298.1 hypothetical protein RhiirB3_405389 [Rhizophagus irregularis]POG73947.1 hypothetical protein GLOIN_2v1580957 [Rhizophagus irregularis DAOM 181602=DAOM 197198]UZO26796.1 hypothetical protein OCT59_019009 [Rhizophagus irregularis]|eukprot:XP_025180813.1 hypothetical protein GLOIN_2v1580957 [Rhizophagus irregularis DAOM 181602=DAOM 197198]
MPVGIVQVMNNTGFKLYYNNIESGRTFEIDPKTQQYENYGWIPCSDFYDDTLPYASSGKHIKIQLNNYTPMKISDNNWKFKIVGPTGPSGEETEDWYGSLRNGDKYIIRLDEVKDNYGSKFSIMAYEYEDKYKSTGGHIVSQIIQHAAAAFGIVLMAKI